MPVKTNKKNEEVDIRNFEGLLTSIVENSGYYKEQTIQANEEYHQMTVELKNYQDDAKKGIINKNIDQNRLERIIRRREKYLEKRVDLFSPYDINEAFNISLNAELTDFKNYDRLNKESILALYNDYHKNLSAIFDAEPNKDGKYHGGYLENHLVSDFKKMTMEERQQLLQKKTDKELIRTVAYKLTEENVIHYLDNGVKTVFDPRFYGKETKDHIAFGNLSADNLKKFAVMAKDINDIVKSIPWYSKIFSFRYHHCVDALDTAKQFLNQRGIDAKELDKFMDSKEENKEAALAAMMEKSKDRIAEKIAANQNKINTLKEEGFDFSKESTAYKETLMNNPETIITNQKEMDAEFKALNTLDRVADVGEEINFDEVNTKDEIIQNEEKTNIEIDLGEDADEIVSDFVEEDDKNVVKEIDNGFEDEESKEDISGLDK